jgi:hypothetical protein
MVGAVSIRRRYFWSRATGGLCPLDQPLGVDDNTATCGARRVCCTLGVIHDFDQAAQDLYAIAGIRISAEKLRQLVEQEGREVVAARLSGALEPAWSAPQAERVYVGVDGVLVRTVTQAEKKKRRQQHQARREDRQRAGLGNSKSLPPLRSGTTDNFKEMKIGLFYDQEKTCVLTFATQEDHIGFGHLLGNQAMQLDLGQADESISLTDGAPWIRNRILEHIPSIDAMLLDFYHFSGHVWDAAKGCLPDPQEAKAWAEARLREVKEVGPLAVLAAIAKLNKKVRSASKHECLRLLRGYITERFEMLDYRRALARGWDIGSGPTEAMCKNLTLRLKRTGMKWDPDNAAAIMNLAALRESGQWNQWWNRSAA